MTKDELKEKILECSETLTSVHTLSIFYLNWAMLKSNKKNIDKYKLELNVLVEDYKNKL